MATDIVIRDQSRRIIVEQGGRSIVVPVAPRRISIVHGAIINLQVTGGGVTDHGALTGLGDDDHPQYLTNGRGDARYDVLGAATAAIAALANSAPATLDTLNELATALGNDPNFATTIINALAGKAALVHTHSGLAPTGGAAGQVLKKIDGTDFNYSWQADAGGAGAQQVYVQQTRPAGAGPWVWWQTDATGAIVDLTVNDGL